MARNGSGTYTVPNTFVAGTTISSSDENQNFSDLGSEITNSVAADGQTTMTGPLKHSSGTALAPSITFGSDTDTGFYRTSANSVGLSLNGALAIEFSTANTVFSVPVTFSSTASFVATAAFTSGFIASATATFAGELIASATATFTTEAKVAGSPVIKQSDVAAQSDMETGTSLVKFVSPGRAHSHKSAAKAWVVFSLSGTTVSVLDSFNVTSVTRSGVGAYTVNFTTAFSSTAYTAAIGGPPGTNGTNTAILMESANSARSASAISLVMQLTGTGSGSAVDATLGYATFYGDQS